MDIFVRYCGGCNCQLDRSKLVSDVQNVLGPENRLTTDSAGAPHKAGLLVCGCTAACAESPGNSNWARRWVVVAGKTVNARELAEDRLAEAVAGEIKAITAMSNE